MADAAFFLTGDAEADALLAEDRLALLIGMVLDQQVPIEWAFAAPATLKRRLGDGWGVAGIAAMDPEELVAAFVAKPALHRYPAAMARRIAALCRELDDRHGGDIEALWRDADAATVVRRLRTLPGFGPEKTRIFLAVLAKKYGVTPDGWQQACAPFGDEHPRTAADINSPETLAAVRAWKKAQRAAGKGKAD
ncbi:MAG: HhH-GPD-type base excision DNA repair protein [Acidimicrobiia bacterium]